MNASSEISVHVTHRICCLRLGRAKQAGPVILAALLMAGPVAAGVIGGFGGPLFGLATAPNGDLLVADAGAGIIGIRRYRTDSALALPGVTDVSPIGRGSMWAVTGGAPDPEADSGQGLHRVSRGTSRKIANLFEFENTYNPDGFVVDTNPFDVQSLGGEAALVADAGGNDLLRVSNQGQISVLAVFPNEIVSTANIKQLSGCQPADVAGFCGLPPLLPAQPVPTSIAVGPDGYIYVGELKGFPAPTGESNIWRIAPWASWAQCGSSLDCVKAFDGGFTSIIDLAFGPDGRLYVAELDEASWAAVEIFGTPAGGTVNACDVDTGTCSAVATGILELTAISFGTDGSLWATRNSLIPGAAEVVQLQ
jgi:hypothetical protein